MMKRLWKFFKHSSVNCVLSLHYASSKLNIFKQQTCLVFQIFVYHSFGRLPLNNLKSCKKYKIFPNINFIASFICLIIICLRWLWDVNLWKRQNFFLCWLWDASKIIENIMEKPTNKRFFCQRFIFVLINVDSVNVYYVGTFHCWWIVWRKIDGKSWF
jgi:hypothetical protein